MLVIKKWNDNFVIFVFCLGVLSECYEGWFCIWWWLVIWEGSIDYFECFLENLWFLKVWNYGVRWWGVWVVFVWNFLSYVVRYVEWDFMGYFGIILFGRVVVCVWIECWCMWFWVVVRWGFCKVFYWYLMWWIVWRFL